jgi:hypothetical protein
MGVRRDTSIALLALVGTGFASVAGLVVGVLEPSEASCLAAGGALATAILTGLTKDAQDALYPARLQLARFRRSEKPADILVALPSGPRGARRGSARLARSALRVTDGAAVLSSGMGHGLCAVLEPDARARSAIEHRLRDVCGSDIRAGWATFPEDGVTLESLIAAATDRVIAGATDRIPDHTATRPPQPLPRMRPSDLPSPSFGSNRASIGGRIERH